MYVHLEVWWCVISVHILLVSGHTPCREKQIVTFNTGLTPYVPNYARRRALISQALTQTRADVVCLQEVWFEKDMQMILDSVSNVFPYTWSPLHYTTTTFNKPVTGFWGLYTEFIKSTKELPCSHTTTAPFVWCVLTECTPNPASLFACVLQNCASLLFSLTQTCLTCVVVGGTDLCSTLSRCLGLRYDNNRINVEGLLVLSKSRISSVGAKRYFPQVKQLLPRGYLEVQVEDVGAVVCTHLSTSLDAVSGVFIEAQIQATTGISSWEELQRVEIMQLLTNFPNKHLLAGDFNTGPGIAQTIIQAKFPNNYALFSNSSYQNDYVARIGTCTICANNPLRRSTSSSIVDHVLLENITAISSERVLETSNRKELLSDHFGVQVTVCT